MTTIDPTSGSMASGPTNDRQSPSDPRDLVDPELLGGLAGLAIPHLTAETLAHLRRELLPPAAATDPADEDVTVATYMVPGFAGQPDVRVLVYRPASAQSPLPALLHMHGGGYVMGTPEISVPRCRDYVRQLGCAVASVDYRLAPETPYPGALEDCYAALRWLHGAGGALGLDHNRIAVTGESAGGGLAAAVALLARDRGEVQLCYQALLYPMLDDRTDGTHSLNPHVGHLVWDAACNHFGWNAYLGRREHGGDVSRHAAPARAVDLTGLPPAYIGTGSLDLFLEEDVAYAMRLLRAGVPVDLHVYSGAYHAFDYVQATQPALALRDDLFRGLRRAFSAGH